MTLDATRPGGPRGVMLPPGRGRLIEGGGLHATLKVAGGDVALTSTFEVKVPPGYDVGAHVHSRGQELFYVVDGTVDLLALEPVSRAEPDWRRWVSADGDRHLRGGPGSLMFIPAGCPHAFANPTDRPATLLFQSAPSGHEDYFDELAALLRAADGPPTGATATAIEALRRRHDIHQLTPLRDRR